MAGVAGLEPTNAGIKIQCLTTWLHPYLFYIFGAGDENRTHDLKDHNLAL